MNQAIVLIHCPDSQGITAALTSFVYEHKGNIIHADQHIDDQTNTFFMRIQWSLDEFAIERCFVGTNAYKSKERQREQGPLCTFAPTNLGVVTRAVG